MDKNLARDISTSFANFITEMNMEIAVSFLDVKCFGNIIVIARGGNFDLRGVRDRGINFVDIGSSMSNDWHPLSRVLSFVNNKYFDEDPNTLMENLSKNLHSVTQLMQGDLQKSGYLDFEKEFFDIYKLHAPMFMRKKNDSPS